MRKEPETIFADLGFENLMAFIYGWYGHNGSATHKPATQWKRELIQLFGTIRTAIEKNVTGDTQHKENMMEHCTRASESIRQARSKDDISCATAQFAFELIFNLLGRLPNNYQKSKAYHARTTELSEYRTLSYTRTDRQKVKQITDYAYDNANHMENNDPTFDELINKLKKDFANNPHKFLTWLKAEYKPYYDKFI